MKNYKHAAALLLALVAAHPPNVAATLNPDVTPDTLGQTICRPGYSDTVRPSTSYTNPIKFRLMEQSGITREDAKAWALDHRLAIGLGGHPRALDNLQLLTRTENSRKSRIEAKMICYVCTGALPLHQAQAEVLEDWRAAYHRWAPIKCRR